MKLQNTDHKNYKLQKTEWKEKLLYVSYVHDLLNAFLERK